MIQENPTQSVVAITNAPVRVENMWELDPGVDSASSGSGDSLSEVGIATGLAAGVISSGCMQPHVSSVKPWTIPHWLASIAPSLATVARPLQVMEGWLGILTMASSLGKIA